MCKLLKYIEWIVMFKTAVLEDFSLSWCIMLKVDFRRWYVFGKGMHVDSTNTQIDGGIQTMLDWY